MQRTVSRRERRYLRAYNLLTSINSPPQKNHSFPQHILSGCAPSRNTQKKTFLPHTGHVPSCKRHQQCFQTRTPRHPLVSPSPHQPQVPGNFLGKLQKWLVWLQFGQRPRANEWRFPAEHQPLVPSCSWGRGFPGSWARVLGQQRGQNGLWDLSVVLVHGDPNEGSLGPFSKGNSALGCPRSMHLSILQGADGAAGLCVGQGLSWWCQQLGGIPS